MPLRVVIVFFLSLSLLTELRAQNQLIRLNLTEVSNDRLPVEIEFRNNASSHFIIPCNFPGQYQCYNTGQLLNNISFTGEAGNSISYSKVAPNDFYLNSVSKKITVRYTTDDTYDHTNPSLNIFPPLGTSFEPGRCFVLNMYAIAGYMKEQQGGVSLLITKPEYFKAPPTEHVWTVSTTRDSFYFSNYAQMTDHPIIYSYTESKSLQIGNTTFHFTCLNAGFPDIHFVSRSMQQACGALIDFTGSRAPSSIQLVFYFKNENSGSTNQQYGAVQHSSTGFFYFPVYADSLRLKRELVKTMCHEFLHTYPAFNIKTNMLSTVFSEDDRTTENLWYYEGVVEYFAWLLQLKYKLITTDEFLEEMSEKMNLSDLYGKFSLTENSKKIHLEEGVDKYPNYYNKGAVAAWMLDIEILKLSGGKQNLKLALDSFYESHKQITMRDSVFIPRFIQSTGLPLDTFFKNYFSGTASFAYEPQFDLIGLQYKKNWLQQSYNLGNLVLVYDDIKNNWTIVNIWAAGLPFQKGDVIQMINANEVSRENIYRLLDAACDVQQAPAKSVIRIARNGKQYDVSVTPSVYIKAVNNYLKTRAELSEKQSLFYNLWSRLQTGSL